MSEGAFKMVMFHFMEAIHIELSDKAIHFFMSEVSREDNFFKLDYIFNDEL